MGAKIRGVRPLFRNGNRECQGFFKLGLFQGATSMENS